MTYNLERCLWTVISCFIYNPCLRSDEGKTIPVQDRIGSGCLECASEVICVVGPIDLPDCRGSSLESAFLEVESRVSYHFKLTCRSMLALECRSSSKQGHQGKIKA